MSQWHSDLLWALCSLGAVVVFCTAWVLVTALRNACRHEWENNGPRCWVKIHNDFGEHVDNDLRQPVRCKKCGRCSYFNVG